MYPWINTNRKGEIEIVTTNNKGEDYERTRGREVGIKAQR